MVHLLDRGSSIQRIRDFMFGEGLWSTFRCTQGQRVSGWMKIPSQALKGWDVEMVHDVNGVNAGFGLR
ncbi:hypothetical protein KR52_12195 [Synechococcus sp. KORDI-52]|nr:hypothetical protein KR52_12195 [Synechococcus sp. KORDI-52]